jgi:preprotein translocase subunit SecD
MSKFKQLYTNWRIILLVVFILFSVWTIQPNPSISGVAVRNVIENSSADLAGIKNPGANIQPMQRERITAVNNKPIETLKEYHEEISNFIPETPYTITTDKKTYRLTTKAITKTITTNDTIPKVISETYQENITVENITQLVNKTRNKTIYVPKTETIVIGMEDIGLKVYDSPTSNIRKGLDLEGGTRVLLRPEEKLSADMFDLLLDNMERRLNIYGLSDIVIRKAGDLLSDEQYIIVEIAGVNEEDVKTLISQQGVFEAKVGNETVFIGGEGDITRVCKTPDCSGIDPYQGCGQLESGEWTCRFRFSISLKPEAAKRQADITDKLQIITVDEQGNPLGRDNQYLNDSLYLFLDGKEVDSLRIGADLKGKAVSDISISGSGVGATQQEAVSNALENMKQLQTVLITGSLPSKLEILKSDNLSPELGSEFLKNALLIGLFSIISVSLVIFIRYRKWQVIIPMCITMISEVILILGFAALIRQNLDLAAIAGIIVAVGTGVDDQIVITDETLRGESRGAHSVKEKIKRAFFIIMAAFFTTSVAMIPLLFAGAGLLRGFAITTLIGVTFGVFVTRPAFGVMIEIFTKE